MPEALVSETPASWRSVPQRIGEYFSIIDKKFYSACGLTTITKNLNLHPKWDRFFIIKKIGKFSIS